MAPYSAVGQARIRGGPRGSREGLGGIGEMIEGVGAATVVTTGGVSTLGVRVKANPRSGAPALSGL